MTRSQLTTGRRFAEALAAGDAKAALAIAHAEIELCLPCAVLHGHAGLRQLLARASLGDDEIVVGGVIEIRDRVVALGRIDGQRVGAIIDVRDGRVARWQAFPDAELAVAAARAAD